MFSLFGMYTWMSKLFPVLTLIGLIIRYTSSMRVCAFKAWFSLAIYRKSPPVQHSHNTVMMYLPLYTNTDIYIIMCYRIRLNPSPTSACCVGRDADSFSTNQWSISIVRCLTWKCTTTSAVVSIMEIYTDWWSCARTWRTLNLCVARVHSRLNAFVCTSSSYHTIYNTCVSWLYASNDTWYRTGSLTGHRTGSLNKICTWMHITSIEAFSLSPCAKR